MKHEFTVMTPKDSSYCNADLLLHRDLKARQVLIETKVMLSVFFDYEHVVHHEYAPQGQISSAVTLRRVETSPGCIAVARVGQWYSTGGTRTPGGTRRHLRGYVKFKISISILFPE
jgi:hypothetical protein